MKNNLDYESAQSHEIMVRAVVGRSPPSYAEQLFTVNVVGVNDNAPVFAVEDTSAEMLMFVDRYSPKGSVAAKVSFFFQTCELSTFEIPCEGMVFAK